MKSNNVSQHENAIKEMSEDIDYAPLTLTFEQRRDVAVALVNLGYRKVKGLKRKIDKSKNK